MIWKFKNKNFKLLQFPVGNYSDRWIIQDVVAMSFYMRIPHFTHIRRTQTGGVLRPWHRYYYRVAKLHAKNSKNVKSPNSSSKRKKHARSQRFPSTDDIKNASFAVGPLPLNQAPYNCKNHCDVFCFQKSVKLVTEQDTSDDDFFYLHGLSDITSTPKSMPTKLQRFHSQNKTDLSLDVNGTYVNFEIDTGAHCYVIPKFKQQKGSCAWKGTIIPVANKSNVTVSMEL